MNESPGVFYFMKKKLELIMSLCLLAAAFILAKQGAVLVQSEKAAREKSVLSSMPVTAEVTPERWASTAHSKRTSTSPSL